MKYKSYINLNVMYIKIHSDVWFGCVLWHINHWGLSNAKSSLYIYIRYKRYGLVVYYGISTIVGYLKPDPLIHIYIEYIWFSLVWFYGIPTIVGYLMPNPLYTYILDIYDLVVFYGISTIVGYLMPNSLYTYILDIYDLVWLCFMAYQPLLVI